MWIMCGGTFSLQKSNYKSQSASEFSVRGTGDSDTASEVEIEVERCFIWCCTTWLNFS